MKKFLGSALTLALLCPVVAHAELLKNFKASGSLEVDAVSANNIADLRTDTYDHIGTVQTRLFVNADWDLLDDVHSHVTLRKNDRTYGTGSQNLNTVQSALFVDQAYAKIDKLFGAIDTTVGRQYYGEPGDMVIYYGPRNVYGLFAGVALDSMRMDWNGEKVGVTAIGGVNSGAALGVKDSGTINVYGLEVHAKPVDALSGSAYVYERTTVNSGSGGNAGAVSVTGGRNLWVAGLRAQAAAGGAWIKGEYDQNFGENRTVDANGNYTVAENFTGWATKLNTGYKADLSRIGMLTGWAEGMVASGGTGAGASRGFYPILTDYRPGLIYGRFDTNFASTALNRTGFGNLDIGPSNRVILGAGAKVTPAALSKLTVALSFWHFRAQSGNDLLPAAKGNKFLGNEYDLELTWAHSENVSVSAGFGDFQPGRALIVSGAGAINPATMCTTNVSIKF